MGIFGKWIGGGLGFAVGGPIGGLLGFLVGSMIDGTTVHTSTYTSGTGITSQGDFGMSLLVLVAAVMKADGRLLSLSLIMLSSSLSDNSDRNRQSRLY
jgi:DnaJ like chaperone protein